MLSLYDGHHHHHHYHYHHYLMLQECHMVKLKSLTAIFLVVKRKTLRCLLIHCNNDELYHRA